MERVSGPGAATRHDATSEPRFPQLTDFGVMQLRRQAGMLSSKFLQTGNLADAQAAIESRHRLLSFMGENHPETSLELTGLAFIFMQRFERHGNPEDLEEAIRTQRNAVSSSSSRHQYKASVLSVLGTFLRRRFETLSYLPDLDEAISYHEYSFLIASDDHEDLPTFASNLGGSLAARFSNLGEIDDIYKAIQCLQMAVSLAPDTHPEKPKFLNNLGLATGSKSKHLGEIAGFEEAIEYQQRAMTLVADAQLSRNKLLNDLAISFRDKFELSCILSDIDAAIDCHQRILSTSPSDHSEVTYAVWSLGNAFESRFQLTNDVNDLNKAIDYGQQAVSSIPDTSSEKSERFTNLGSLFAGRFKRFGDVNDINQAIGCHRKALLFLPDKPGALSNLGLSLYERFGRGGNLADLDQAIEYLDLANTRLSRDNLTKATLLSNLGLAYERRSEHLDSVIDLEKAITCHQQAILITPNALGKNSGYLNNLGLSLARRFARSGDPKDIDRAIESYKSGLPKASDGNPENIGLLDNLGVAYGHRFRHSRELEDINQSIHYQEKAISLINESNPEKPGMLNNLGVSFGRRFGHSGNLADVDKAIECQQQAVALTPDGHLQKPRFLTSLSFSVFRRLERLKRPEDAKLMLGYLEQAAKSSSGPAIIRFATARQWAQMSEDYPESNMDAYRTAMGLLPRLVWLGSSTDRRYEDVAQVEDLATEAAAAAITTQNHDQALEWLEEGRAIVWRQQLQLRTPLDDVRAADSALAEKLETVGKQLETGANPEGLNTQTMDNTGSLEMAARSHRRSAEEWDRLVAEARRLPGLENFLRPRKVADLAPAARRGSIVVINVHKSRCDALALRPGKDGVMHIPLPLFSHEKATKVQSGWTESLQGFGIRDRGFRKASMPRPNTMNGGEVLALLWTEVVEPVLSALGYLRIQPTESPPPHITWCTTGPLSFVPIHAAGDYSPETPQKKVYNYVISSYTPTLSALLSPAKCSNEFRGLLTVGQDLTAGLSPLPCAIEELGQIKRIAGDLPMIQLAGDEATVDAVLSQMKSSSWVHLACHAVQDAVNPTESSFFLHDGRLNLAAITKEPLKHAGFAFLSACQTALGHKELPEEAIHLAAGMIMAGYPTVIGTMWSIRDSLAPVVAAQVYARLLKDGVPSTEQAAEALHEAVAYLRREVGENRFEDWAPFIHIGV